MQRGNLFWLYDSPHLDPARQNEIHLYSATLHQMPSQVWRMGPQLLGLGFIKFSRLGVEVDNVADCL